LIQAICFKLWKLREQNLGFRMYRRALILENKWRGSPRGGGGQVVDFREEDRGAVLGFLGREVCVFGGTRGQSGCPPGGGRFNRDTYQRQRSGQATSCIRKDRRRSEASGRLHLRRDEPRLGSGCPRGRGRRIVRRVSRRSVGLRSEARRESVFAIGV